MDNIPWPRLLMISVFLLTIVVVLTSCASAACTTAEQAVFAEFPQYKGKVMQPEPNTDTGSCAVYYETPDAPLQVQQYFADQLQAHGWTVELPPSGIPVNQTGGILISAERDQFAYVVHYESLEVYNPPQPGTHVAVHVSQQ